MPLFRIPLEPNEDNGLLFPSRIMVDTILTIRKEKLGYRIGALSMHDINRLNRALLMFLGLVG
jgi:mRNA interferase MazF